MRKSKAYKIGELFAMLLIALAYIGVITSFLIIVYKLIMAI